MEQQFKRAKSDANKILRMNQIMDVTDRLFHEHTYHEITLAMIAKEAGFARGGIYKYVSSKEEIFLKIYLNRQEHMLEEMCAGLEKLSSPSLEETAGILADAVYHAMDLIRYHRILTSIIETNSTVEKLAEFKLSSYRQRQSLFRFLETVCHTSEDQAYDAFLTIIYHAVCLYDRVAYHESYKEAMRIAGLPITEIDFTSELRRFISLYLNSIAKEKDQLN